MSKENGLGSVTFSKENENSPEESVNINSSPMLDQDQAISASAPTEQKLISRSLDT